MRRFICSVFVVLLVACGWTSAAQAQDTAYLKARIVGYDGQVLPYAVAARVSNMTSYPPTVLETYPVDGDGYFEADLRAPAVHRITMGGLYHDSYRWPFYVEPGDTVEVEVQLGALARSSSDTLAVVWSPDHTVREPSAWQRVRVAPYAPGRYRVTLAATGDTLAYGVWWEGLYGAPRSSGLYPADRFRPDRELHQDALVATRGDSTVTLDLDLSDVPPEPTKWQVTWLRAPERTRQFAELIEDHEQRSLANRAFRAGERAKGISSIAIPDDWSADIEALERKVKQEKDPFMRQVWMMGYLRMGSAHRFQNAWEPDRRLAKQILKEVDPQSPLWSYRPGLFAPLRVLSREPRRVRPEDGPQRGQPEWWNDRYRDYVAAYAQHPDSSAARHWLGSAITWAERVGDFEMLSIYYGEYMQRMAGTRHAEIMAHRFRRHRTVDVGHVVPDFAFPGLDDPQQVTTRADMMGRPYILTFWASWCGPCKPKTERLATAHEQYEAAGLDVFSVSLDFRRKDALDFREQVHPMPWRNAYLNGWKSNEGALADFELRGVPYSLLIDEQGTIVSIDDGTDMFWDDLIAFMDSR
ncbi:MAG: TlpA disulfide reductase family protein [Bacteroidota bacterium]